MSNSGEVPRKIAVFGSAFNPPSLGHKSVIESLTHFDQVLLVPSISHAWGKTMLSFQLRCQMVALFIEDIDLNTVRLSTVEEMLHKPDQSVTTYAVLDKLQTENPNSDITFILGPDNLLNFDKFYRASDILMKWSVLACPEKISVRSTDIRTNMANKQPISHLTTDSVQNFIMENKLYWR